MATVIELRPRQHSPLGQALAALVGWHVVQLERDGVEDPLAQPFTLAAVLYDLLTLAGGPIPDEIVARIDAKGDH